MNTKIAEWFEYFKFAVKQCGVDTSDPISCARIKAIDPKVVLSGDSEAYLQTQSFAGQEKGLEPAEPYGEWLTSNLKSLETISEERITTLYELAKTGRIIVFPADFNNQEMQQVYTNTEGRVSVSGSISTTPHYSHVLMDGSYPDDFGQKQRKDFHIPLYTEDPEKDKRIFAQREAQTTIEYKKVMEENGLYQDASNPEVLGRVFTTFEDANGSFMMLSDSLMPDAEKDAKIALDRATAQMLADLKDHPDYYADPGLKQARLSYIFSGSDTADLANVLDSNFAEAGMELRTLISKGLIVDEQGAPVPAEGEQPWLKLEAFASGIADEKKYFLKERTADGEERLHALSLNWDTNKLKIAAPELTADFIEENRHVRPMDLPQLYTGREARVRAAYAELAEYGLEFTELEIMDAVNNPPDPTMLEIARRLTDRTRSVEVVNELAEGMEFYAPLNRLPHYMIDLNGGADAKANNLAVLEKFKTKEGYRAFLNEALNKARHFDIAQLRNLDFEGFAKKMQNKEFKQGLDALLAVADFMTAMEAEGIGVSEEERDALVTKCGAIAGAYSCYQTTASRMLDPAFGDVRWNKGTLAKYTDDDRKVRALTDGMQNGDYQTFFNDGATVIYKTDLIKTNTCAIDCLRGFEANNIAITEKNFKCMTDYLGKTARVVDKDGNPAFYRVDGNGDLKKVWQNDVPAKDYKDQTELGQYSADRKTAGGVFKELSDILDELKKTGPGLITNSKEFNTMYTSLNGLVHYQKSLSDNPTSEEIERFTDAAKAVNKAVTKYLNYKSGDVEKRPGDRAYKRYALALNLKDLSDVSKTLGSAKAAELKRIEREHPQAQAEAQQKQRSSDANKKDAQKLV